MTDRTQPAIGPQTGRRRAYLAPLATFVAAVALAALGTARIDEMPAPLTLRSAAPAPTEQAALTAPETPAEAPAAPVPSEITLDPWPGTLGGKLSRWAWTQRTPEAAVEQPAPEASAPAAEPPRTAMIVPLPVPRPAELRNGTAPVRRAARPQTRQEAALPAPPPEDNRSFFEKLFGVESPPARAYTSLETKPVDPTPRPRLSPPLAPPAGEGGTATYDISARLVTLPNGEKLEAHSGLGEIMDDPRYVNVRMRGATPPGTYVLTEREQPFHGVRAIRLTPVGGSEAVFGRVGLLAHTFMLGPSGASNGCVSFRDYNRFLEAYLRGEIRQLVVVPGAGGAVPPSSVASTSDAAIRLARN
jgi:hypothetical protein